MKGFCKTIAAFAFAGAICLGGAGMSLAAPNDYDRPMSEEQIQKAREILVKRGELRPADGSQGYQGRYYDRRQDRRDWYDDRDYRGGYHHRGYHRGHGCW